MRLSNVPLSFVQQLDDLSENLKTLAVQLGKFFVHVNSDVDRYAQR